MNITWCQDGKPKAPKSTFLQGQRGGELAKMDTTDSSFACTTNTVFHSVVGSLRVAFHLFGWNVCMQAILLVAREDAVEVYKVSIRAELIN